MKKSRKIFLNIILLLVVFSCTSTFLPANFYDQQYIIEQSNVSDDTENKIAPDFDSSDEDQLVQSIIIGLARQSDCQNSYLFTFSVFNNFFVSIWQPPKLS